MYNDFQADEIEELEDRDVYISDELWLDAMSSLHAEVFSVNKMMRNVCESVISKAISSERKSFHKAISSERKSFHKIQESLQLNVEQVKQVCKDYIASNESKMRSQDRLIEELEEKLAISGHVAIEAYYRTRYEEYVKGLEILRNKAIDALNEVID
jgi:hypothetical protein